MHVLAGALLAFPDSTVRDTARFVMKASATGGGPASARRHARNGHSRRQMARVVEALEQGRLQRLITRSGSRLRPSYRRADAQSRSIFILCHTTAGGSARDS